MIDEFKYEYIPLGLPNVVYERERGIEGPVTLVVNEFLWPLIARLAKARPNWRFVSRGKHYDGRVKRFTIYEGHEELGWVRKAWRDGHGDSYEYDCRRMNDARQRGVATITKNPSKAFKDITKSFGVKTITELLQEARDYASSAAAVAVNRASQEYTNVTNALRAPALAYALVNWETFKQFAAETPPTTNPYVLENFHDIKDMYEEAEKLIAARNSGQHTVVMLRGSDYVLLRDEQVNIVKSDDLTPHMKRAIGMLKLAEDGTFIPGMGVRGKQNAFIILDE